MGVLEQHVDLWDSKFTKSLRCLQKESGASQIWADESYFTWLLWTEILENAGFYAGPTIDALEVANSSREQSLQGEPWPSMPFLDFVKTSVLIGKLRHQMVNVVEDTSIRRQMVPFWEAKYPGRYYVFEWMTIFSEVKKSSFRTKFVF